MLFKLVHVKSQLVTFKKEKNLYTVYYTLKRTHVIYTIDLIYL